MSSKLALPKLMRNQSAADIAAGKSTSPSVSPDGNKRGGRLLRTLSGDGTSGASRKVFNVAGNASRGVAGGLAATFELGKASMHGVAGLGAAGVHGVAELGAAGVHGVADRAKNLTGRPKTSSARKRCSELNIFGNADVVSADFTMQSIRESKKNALVTKLELEDIVNRDDDKHAEVFATVKELLENDGGRSWQFIKFLDSLRIGELGMDPSYLQQYEQQRRQLWESIKGYSDGKPIMFQVKVEVGEGTATSTVLELLAEMLNLNLVKLECTGGLYGFKPPEIGDALAELCRPEFEDDGVKNGELSEMIMFVLEFSNSDETPAKERVWKKVLRRCVNRLKGRSVSSDGSLGSDLHTMQSAAGGGNSVRAHSPRRAAVRSLSGDLKTLSLAGNSGLPERSLSASNKTSSDSRLTSTSAHQKRRKPRNISSGRQASSSSALDKVGSSKKSPSPTRKPKIERCLSTPNAPKREISPELNSSSKHKSKLKTKRTNSNKPAPNYDWTNHAKGASNTAKSA